MKDRKLFVAIAILCVAVLLSTSLIVLTGSSDDSDKCTSSYELDDCMHVDDDGSIVAVCDGTGEFVGEKERLGQCIPASNVFKAGGLTYMTYPSDGIVGVIDYDGGYKHIVVPDKVSYDGREWPVGKINDWGLTSKFEFARHPLSVEIGPSVVTLGAHSFSDEFCADDHLREFRIRDIDKSKLTTIESEAFYKTLIRTIELPKSLTVIGEKAFKKCNLLETVSLLSATLSIGKQAFCRDVNLVDINLENVRHIGDLAFHDTCLKTLNLTSATEIGEKAFGTGVLRTVVFSNDLVSLHEKAFDTLAVFGHYHFYDTHGSELGQCAENMRGKTFEGNDSWSYKFKQVL